MPKKKDEGLEVADNAKMRQVTSVDCLNGGGGYIRTFSLAEHGKKFQDLAAQFISKKGREGYTTRK